MPEFNLMITGNQYIVPFMIPLDDIYAPIVRAKTLISQIIHHVDYLKENEFMVKLMKPHIYEIQKKITDLHYSLNDFLTHILGYDLNKTKRTRKIRGAFNILGSLANTLFGTATQDQIDYIHDRLHSVETLTEQEREMLNIHSQAINVTMIDLKNVHKVIVKLEKVSNATAKMINSMYIDIRESEQAQIVLESVTHVQLVLSTIAADHVKLRIGLEEMLQSYLSPNVITNDLLLSLLEEISGKMTGLLFPPTAEFLGLHRAAIRVFYKKTALPGLNFYLLIPLRGNPTDTYNVFRMTSLPYPVPNTDSFMIHEPSKKYLVISEYRTSYFLADNFDTCRRHEALLICPPLGPIYTSTIECCELAIFLQKPSASSLCQKFILKRFPPVFIRNNNGWTFATDTPLDITLNCIKNNTVPKVQHTISGTGKLDVGPGCSVHSKTFSLPEFSIVKKTEIMKVTPYPFSVSLTFTPWEHNFLMNATNISLPSSDGLKPVPLQDYIDRLQPLMKLPSTSDQGLPEWLRISTPIGVTLLLLVILAGGRFLHSWLVKKKSDVATPVQAVDPLLQTQPPSCPHPHGARGRAPPGGE